VAWTLSLTLIGFINHHPQNSLTVLELTTDDRIVLTSDPAFKEKGTKEKLYVDYENLWKGEAFVWAVNTDPILADGGMLLITVAPSQS
jgi:hypothetical protein